MKIFGLNNPAFAFYTVCVTVCVGDYVAQTVKDEVGEGNYTYYTLSHPGNLVLHLVSVEGDADLYISSDVDHPTFNFDEHTLSSSTCGEDHVDISKLMRRPINIAVYGHPRFPSSRYALDVIVVEEEEFDPFKDEGDGEGGRRTTRANGDHRQTEESSTIKVVWPIVKSILEILIDVIL